jgi:hypothetical protein
VAAAAAAAAAAVYVKKSHTRFATIRQLKVFNCVVWRGGGVDNAGD